MKYSFIVPVYNVEEYLCKCIDSLLAQTYDDFEIVLVDDGSTDSSGNVVDSYFQKHADKILVEHQENTGLGGARNKGISLARGKYLVMVDSDDYVSNRMLEIIDSYLLKYDNDILIFNYIVEEADGNQRVQRLHDSEGYFQITKQQYIFETPAAWNKVYRASLFKETGISYPERIFYEDVATSPCLAIHASKIGVIEDALYYYIQRESSIMHTKNAERMTEICTAVKIVLEYYKQQDKFEEFYQELEYLTVSHVLCSTIQRILCVKYDYKKIKMLEKFVESYFPNYECNVYVKKAVFKPGKRKEKMIVEKKYFGLFIDYGLRKWAKRFIRMLKGCI